VSLEAPPPVLPRSFINLFAAVGGLGGVVADFNMLLDR
jgi:hypothetical protein